MRHPSQEVDLLQLQRLTSELSKTVADAKEMAKEYEDDRSKFILSLALA